MQTHHARIRVARARRSDFVRTVLGPLLAVTAVAIAGCNRGEAPPGAPPPPEVAVAVADRGNLPLDLEYSARAVGSREVEVRALVSGILLERRYEEGSAVRRGEVLFRLEAAPYRAAFEQAQAELGVEQARLAEARRQRDRITALLERKLVSESQLDEATSAYEVAAASVAAARARLRSAELELGYTEVKAPISGLTSREVRSEGSLVRAEEDSSLLTRIVQTDPIYVEFELPESEAARVRARIAAGRAPSLRLLLDDGREYPDAARLTFVDNAVDPTSGTVHARGVLSNADGRLVPGQFLRARLVGVEIADAVSVPRRAVMSSAQGSFVWLIDAENSAELRPVRLAGTVGDRALIAEGLSGGERVVIEGVLKVQPGAKVKPVEPGAAAAAPAAQAAQGEPRQ